MNICCGNNFIDLGIPSKKFKKHITISKHREVTPIPENLTVGDIKLINDRYKEELDRYCGDNIDCTDILDQRFNEICIKNSCVLCDNILNQRNITKGTCPSKLNHNEKCTPLANSGYIVDPQNSNIKCNYGKLTFPKIIKMDSIL